jgi:hypothetical protein
MEDWDLRTEDSLRRRDMRRASIHSCPLTHSKTRAGVTSMSRSSGSKAVTFGGLGSRVQGLGFWVLGFGIWN